MLRGQDWASYQPEKPDTAGLTFVFVKVTEGLTYTNPRWPDQVTHARAHGLVVGLYHYPHMAQDPVAEADRFLDVAAPRGGDLLVLDWEGYDRSNAGVPRTQQVAYRDAWLAHVKQRMPHHAVGLYCNTEYWLHIDKTGTRGDFLWIATTGRPAGDPGIQGQWMFHQHSTAGGVDHDVCPLPTAAALRAWATAPTTTPTLQEADVQLDDWIRLATWIPKTWPQDKGLADGTLTVGTALGSGYAHARRAAENTDRILAALEAARKTEAAQTAAITALAAQLGQNVDTATVVAAVKQAIADAVVHVDVNVTNPPKEAP